MEKNLAATKKSALYLATLALKERQAILLSLAALLAKEKKNILAANKKDVLAAKRNKKNAAFVNRLAFTPASFDSMVSQVKDIAKAKEVLGTVLEKKIIAGGVKLTKVSVPLGVIGIIYESRPNVTIDVAALCLMSGNACVLKGGSDAIHTNTILAGLVQRVLRTHKVPSAAVYFIESTDRSLVDTMIKAHQYIDVLIPRGGYNLVQKIVDEAKIPVLYHASGGARIYVDASANLSQAINICVNAKTSRPATCNSADNVLVHEKVAKEFIPKLVSELQKKNVEIRGDAATRKISPVLSATEKDYATEFLDYIITIKIVKNVDQAIDHIHAYTKRHSEGLVAKDKKVITKFIESIDAAGLFINCSTRLHDGGVFGLGAEMGVATGKLHARGPVGLRELTTYKWVAYGNGQIRK
jgi:glutamate-5-semialdehyde dehydrogenase